MHVCVRESMPTCSRVCVLACMYVYAHACAHATTPSRVQAQQGIHPRMPLVGLANALYSMRSSTHGDMYDNM